MEDLGFILTRHVRSEDTNRYWIESCRCIRLFYPNTPIIVIDDASNPTYVTGDTPMNCIVVASEYPKRGELLPYLYLKKHRSFKKTVILHDSVFLTAPIPTDAVTDVKFLWHFDDRISRSSATETLMTALPEYADMNTLFQTTQWCGCFGVQSVIALDFLDTLPLEILVDHIRGREDRCALERVFALLCHLRLPALFHSPSLFGSIHCQTRGWGYTFQEYQRHQPGVPVKVWTGR
jgi:hypothetical protein